MARAGIEPATFHFSGERYYQLSYLAVSAPHADLATPTGLEPATSAVTGRRANQLRHGANFLTCWPAASSGNFSGTLRICEIPISPASAPDDEPHDMALIGIPNGIRTRVAAVKGRSPRPLDDGDRTREE